MAERERRNESQPPLASAAVIIAAILAGFVFYDRPLTSSRPRTNAVPGAGVANTVSRVRARLWQDPFSAVAEHDRLHGEKDARCQQANHQICHIAQGSESAGASFGGGTRTRVVVLPVLVEGGMLPSAIESRTRDRYAVISALGQAGFVPRSEDSLEYFVYEVGGPAETTVPFEWFDEDARPSVEPTRHCAARWTPDDACQHFAVLVLWIDDGALLPHILGRLVDLGSRIRDDGNVNVIDVRVVGPRRSQSLLELVGEAIAHEPPANRHEDCLPRELNDGLQSIASAPCNGVASDRAQWRAPALSATLTVFSPWATIDDRILREKLGVDARTSELALQNRSVRLQRTTSTDDELAHVIVEELGRRNVHLGPLGDPPAEVAVVGEWDTLYGRAFASSLAHAIQERVASTGQRVEGREWVRQFTYLRGLDGSIPRQGRATSDKGDGASGETTQRPTTPQATNDDAPQGSTQLDYLRRLAGRIEAVNASLLRSCPIVDRLKDRCRKLRAIGIVGSDVYDKLLVLQALKPLFPEAIFFTTDLDAMLAHESQLPWSRNLLVVSPFGLELAPKLQRSTPPFRDSYQTAVYYAVLQAVGFSRREQGHGLRSAALGNRSDPAVVPAPRIFEIGRFGPVDMTVVEDPTRAWMHPDRMDIGDPSSKSPSEKVGSFVRNAALWIIVCILGSALLTPVFAKRAARHQAVQTRQLLLLLALVIGATAVFVVIAFLQGSAGEPFGVLSGVSVWPTEVIRFYVFLLSVYLSIQVFRQLATNRSDIEREFLLSSAAEDAASPTPVKKIWREEDRWWRLARMFLEWLDVPSALGDSEAAKRRTVNQIWELYVRRESPGACLLRVGIATALFVSLGYAMMALFGHARVPARHYLTFKIDEWILLLMILTVSFLHCLVLDVTSGCERWVADLGSPGKGASPQDLVRRMQLIEARTATVSRFVYYPLVCAVLSVLSRNSFFDEWRTPPGLLVIFGLLGAYIVISSWILVRGANAARAEALAVLRKMRWRATVEPDPACPPKESIEAATEFIDALREGSFAPLPQHPILGAVVFPVGSLGLLSLIDMLQTLR